MAIVFKDRVEQRTSTTGLSNLTLTGNISMRNRFQDVFSNGDELYYVIEDGNGSQWEVGKGTFTGPSTLSRDTVRANSSGTTTKITLSSNEHRVFAAPDATYLNDVVAIAASHVGVGGDAQHPDANGTTSGFMTAADFTKLAGIESGATDDQTGAEIKALYEAEANTNAFTDAEKSKLSGIEANATADQTGAEIKTAYEAEANTNAFTDAEKSKLAAINQGLATTDAVTFLTINTGQGANELYAMDQNVRTSDSPAFAGLTIDTNTLHVDSANNRVGVGTTSPLASLHISSTKPVIQLTDTNTGCDSQISADSSSGSLIIRVDENAENVNSSLLFFIDGTEKARITPDGELGVGVTVPAAKLDVDGIVKVKSYTVATLPTAVAGGIIYVSDETGGAVLAFSDGTNWRRVTDRAIVS